MEERFLVVGELEQTWNGANWLTHMVRAYVFYNNEPAFIADYANECRPYLPNTLRSSVPVPKGGSHYYTWNPDAEHPEQESVIVSWSCVRNAQGAKEGMTFTVNKLDASVANPVEWEKKRNGGVCAQCNGNQPYNGPLPPVNDQTSSPTASGSITEAPTASGSVTEAPTASQSKINTTTVAPTDSSTSTVSRSDANTQEQKTNPPTSSASRSTLFVSAAAAMIIQAAALL